MKFFIYGNIPTEASSEGAPPPLICADVVQSGLVKEEVDPNLFSLRIALDTCPSCVALVLMTQEELEALRRKIEQTVPVLLRA